MSLIETMLLMADLLAFIVFTVIVGCWRPTKMGT